MDDISAVLVWWLTIFAIGLSLFPLTRRIFHRFIDHGYIFSKVVGIVLLGWITWFLGVAKILPFYRESIFIILLGLGAANILLYFQTEKKGKPSPLPLAWYVIEEVIFLATLAFWSYVKAHEPYIHGLEKFMDFGFVESTLKSTFFPPLDMWLAKSPDFVNGQYINYYYFGHFITALLTKLSGIASNVTYNLMIASLFAFTFSLSFSIGINLVYFYLSARLEDLKKLNFRAILIGGFLSAFIVSLGGNLHTIYAFTAGYPNDTPAPFWNLTFGLHPETYWYPNATRFIPYTIHEFPIYSFVVSDLHGHVSDIPFVLLMLALLLNLLLKIREQDVPKHTSNSVSWVSSFFSEFRHRTSVSLPYLFFLSLIAAIMYMTNALDGLIYLSLTILVFFYINRKTSSTLFQAITRTLTAALFSLFFFLICSLPFSLFFKPFGTGLGVLCAPKFLLGKHFGPLLFEEGKCQKSPLWQLGILWGFFYYMVTSFLIFFVLPKIRKVKNIRFSTPDIFVVLLGALSTLLLIFPEFFYVKDIYPMHYRANTMFKLGYQAFIMLGLASAYIFIKVQKEIRGIGKIFFSSGFLVVFFLIAIYPFFAINSYFGGLKTYNGLDGFTWMKKEYPGDYDAIVWLRNNVSAQDVIVEANGDSYTDYARVSSFTGMPTIIGWPVHEWLWRGSYDEAGKRIPEVQSLYEGKDVSKTKEILQKYNVKYVFLGQLEKQKYPNLLEDKWNNLGTIAYQNDQTKIYKIK